MRGVISCGAGRGRPGGGGWSGAAGRLAVPGSGFAADAGAGELLVQVADQRVKLGGVAAGRRRRGRGALGLGAFAAAGLRVVRRAGRGDRLVFQVPAFPALRGPQRLCAFGAGWADGGQGSAAGHEHLLDLAGVQVGAAELDGPDAPAVAASQFPDAAVASGRARRSARVVRSVIGPHRPLRPARSPTSRTAGTPG